MSFKLIATLLLMIPVTSFSEPWRVPLITNGYDVVTKKDLDDAEKECTELEAFPPKVGCMMYWQCLSTKDAKVICDDLGPDSSPSEKEHIGELRVVLKNKEGFSHFETTHNSGMSDCKALKHSILNVMKNEKIVCISSHYADKENNTSYWIVDRVKSRRGESAWFHEEEKMAKPIF